MSVEINTSDVIKDLDGQPLKIESKELSLGRAFALVLVSGAQSPDPLRAYVLAKNFINSEIINLNASDIEFIKKALSGFQGFSVLVIGQLMEKLS